MNDFFSALQFLRVAALAHDGALAKATVQIAEHRRWPRGYDAPDYVRSVIGIGEACQRYLCRAAALLTTPSFLVAADGTIQPLLDKHGRPP